MDKRRLRHADGTQSVYAVKHLKKQEIIFEVCPIMNPPFLVSREATIGLAHGSKSTECCHLDIQL